MKFRDGQEKAFHDAVRARVGAYLAAEGRTRFGDRRVLLKGLLLLALTVGLYAAILSNRLAGPALLLAAILFGVACILVAFNLAHDAAHDALTPSRRLNRLIFEVTFLLNGTSPTLWKRRHVGSHHTFPNVRGGDADMDDNPFLRVTPSAPYRPQFRYQHLYAPLVYLLFSPYTIFVYDFAFLGRVRLANMDLRRDLRRLRIRAIVAAEKLVYLAATLALPLAVLDQPWWAVVGGFALMHGAASLAFTLPLVSTHIAEEIAFPEADAEGQVPGGWATHQLATSMDYSPESRLANWLLGAVNAHAAHHLFPDVCHVHYVALSRIIRETAREHGVPYHALPFPAALRSHFRHLKRLGNPAATPLDRQKDGGAGSVFPAPPNS